MEAVEPASETTPQSRSELSFDSSRLVALRATGGHAAQIQACFDGAPDYFARTEGKLPGPDAAVHLLADAEVDPNRLVYVLFPRAGQQATGPAVGVLDLHLDYPEPGTAQIGLLLFREACQGLGYGKETTATVEAVLSRAGFRTLRLSVVDENVEAKLFWQRLGFAEVSHLDRCVTVYEKQLPHR